MSEWWMIKAADNSWGMRGRILVSKKHNVLQNAWIYPNFQVCEFWIYNRVYFSSRSMSWWMFNSELRFTINLRACAINAETEPSHNIGKKHE